MSSDNSIVCLRTPKGKSFEFRVSEIQGIDNLEYEDTIIEADGTNTIKYNSNPDNLIKNARTMFSKAIVFDDEKKAIEEAYRINEEECNGYTEYGICYLEIDREF